MSGFAMAHAVRSRMKKKAQEPEHFDEGGMADVAAGTGDSNDSGAAALAKGLDGGGGSGGGGGGGMASMLPMLAMLAKGGMVGGKMDMAKEVMRRRAGLQSPEMLAEGGEADDDMGFMADQHQDQVPVDQRMKERDAARQKVKRGNVYDDAFDNAANPETSERVKKRQAERQQEDEKMHSRVGYSEGGEIDAEHEQREHLLTPEERKNARRGMLTAILSSIHKRQSGK